MRSALLLTLAAALLLAGCGGDPSAELAEHLRQGHEFDSEYAEITDVQVDGGTVTIDAAMPPNPLPRAAVYCEWVSPWAYDHGDADTRIVIRDAGGREMLVRRGLSESCPEALLEAQYG